MSKKGISPSQFILPININGLDGRSLNLPAVNAHNKKQILIVYGFNSNLEKWWGLATSITNYCNVTMVDLPGMGGMDSFYKIKIKPSIDSYADYLASFVKLRFKRKKVSIIGIDIGFVIVTRMLQRNPDLINKVNLIVGINAFSHYGDLSYSRKDKIFILAKRYLFLLPFSTQLVKVLTSNSLFLGFKYSDIAKNPSKENRMLLRFQIDLAKESDARSKNYLEYQLLKLDNSHKALSLPMWHVSLGKPSFLGNPKTVSEHLKVIFRDYHYAPSKLVRKKPVIVYDSKIGKKILPAAVRRQLKKHFA